MTELIVALDGPEPLRLMRKISWMTDHAIKWFKIGPQTMCAQGWEDIISAGYWSPHSLRIFLDLKLADTRDTVTESMKRFADNGVAAVSTHTREATEAAMRAAEGTETKVWLVLCLSDSNKPAMLTPLPPSHGIICPVSATGAVKGIDTICPGIRRLSDEYNGHINVATPLTAVRAGATYAVVGRPIWAADDPVATAKKFRDMLATQTPSAGPS